MSASIGREKEMEVRVYLEDTDAGGIVYHASYLRFMERARTELLRESGVEQSATFQHDVSFVVHSMSLRFRCAAKLDDLLRVSCTVRRLGAASVRFAQQVQLAESRELCVEADVTVACIGLAEGKPRRMPDTLRRALLGQPA